MTGTATFTAALSRFENVQPAAESCDVDGRFVACRFRNIRTTMPAKRTSERVPSDQAVRAAVFGFMLEEDSGRIRRPNERVVTLACPGDSTRLDRRRSAGRRRHR